MHAGCVTTRLRVRFAETDAMGVANNAAYLTYLEVGRIEYLRAGGHSYADVRAGGIDMVVTHAELRYLRPLRFDDEFDVVCRLADVRPASFRFAYELRRGEELCVRATTRHACIEQETLRLVRVPAWLRAGDAEHAARAGC